MISFFVFIFETDYSFVSLFLSFKKTIIQLKMKTHLLIKKTGWNSNIYRCFSEYYYYKKTTEYTSSYHYVSL